MYVTKPIFGVLNFILKKNYHLFFKSISSLSLSKKMSADLHVSTIKCIDFFS